MADYYSGGGGGGGGGTSWPASSDIKGSFWKGADGNVWVYGANGTNSAGQWDDNSLGYWTNQGYSWILDPAGGTLGDSTSNTSRTYNTGGGSSTPSYNQADLDYLNQQENRYKGLLDNTNVFETQANNKLTDSYNSAVSKANLSQSRATEDYNQKTYDDQLAQQKSLDAVDRNAYNLSRSLRMILGLASGSGSSAFQAGQGLAARVAGQQRGNVMSDYSANTQDLLRAKNRTDEDYQNYLNELSADRKAKEGDLRFGYAQQRQSLNDTLAQIAAERASLTGGNPLNAAAPYNAQYDSIQNYLTGLGDQYRTSVAERGLNVAPVSLRNYVVDKQAINANNQYGSSPDSPYYQFLNRKKQDQGIA